MGSSQSKNKEEKTASQAVEEGVGKYVDVVLGFGEDDIADLEAELKKRKEARKNLEASSNRSKPEEKLLLDDYTENRLHELGLGRGIDGTNPRPWINKTAFQVREPKKPAKDDIKVNGNLNCTDEGGMVNDFFEEVTSIETQSSNLTLSVMVPSAPVTVSTGADLTRKLTTTQTAFGKRVLNETIAFTPTCDDSEKRLLKYVLGCEEIEQRLADQSETELKDLFLGFLKRYRTTHYVSSITMGASKFVVKAESEYIKSFSPNAGIGYEPVASVEASASFKKELKKESKNIQCVGRFKDDKTYEVTKEAVVGVKLEPISNLFETKKFEKAMKGALEAFIIEQKRKKEGPYIISCNDASIYLKTVVNSQTGHARVYATENLEEASKFYILLTDNGANPYEFYIGWQKEAAEEGKVRGTMRYLTAHASICGRCDGPLCLESRAKKSISLFSINSRLTNPMYRFSNEENVNPELWYKGEESFLIRCTRRRGRIDGFIAIERAQGVENYQTICRKNAEGHDNGNFHMTFRLHSSSNWENLPNSPASQAKNRVPEIGGSAAMATFGIKDTKIDQ